MQWGGHLCLMLKLPSLEKPTEKVAYNINASVRNALSIHCVYKCMSSYTAIAFILFILPSLCGETPIIKSY